MSLKRKKKKNLTKRRGEKGGKWHKDMLRYVEDEEGEKRGSRRLAEEGEEGSSVLSVSDSERGKKEQEKSSRWKMAALDLTMGGRINIARNERASANF